MSHYFLIQLSVFLHQVRDKPHIKCKITLGESNSSLNLNILKKSNSYNNISHTDKFSLSVYVAISSKCNIFNRMQF